jgi:hypothetical protein
MAPYGVLSLHNHTARRPVTSQRKLQEQLHFNNSELCVFCLIFELPLLRFLYPSLFALPNTSAHHGVPADTLALRESEWPVSLHSESARPLPLSSAKGSYVSQLPKARLDLTEDSS